MSRFGLESFKQDILFKRKKLANMGSVAYNESSIKVRRKRDGKDCVK